VGSGLSLATTFGVCSIPHWRGSSRHVMVARTKMRGEAHLRKLSSMAIHLTGAPRAGYVLDRILHVIFWSCIVMMTILHSDGLTPLQKAVSSDFSSFYQVGQLARDGHYADAYDLQAFSQMQMKASGKTSFFP